MLIEEEPKDEPKIGDINPDALEAVFAEESDTMGEEEDIVNSVIKDIDVIIYRGYNLDECVCSDNILENIIRNHCIQICQDFSSEKARPIQ